MKNERLFGVGEPLIQRQRDQGIRAAECMDLVDGLGCRAYRSWMHITEILKDPKTPDPQAVADHTALLDRAKELDIEVTGMSHEWFLPEGCLQRSGHAMPKRDLTEGSLYMQALEMLEESWYTMASLFPQVAIWEVGNEWNLNAFLHPDGFLDSDMSHPFTPDEKYDIAVDMMYFSAKGIRRGNPEAKVASFSPAPYVFTTKEVSDRDLFLDVEEPDTLWRDFNDAAYRVMRNYGDGDKQVILTETGFTDLGNPDWEERYARYTKTVMRYAEAMPYVRTVHNFRLLNENAMLKRAGIEDNQIGGITEVYFGLFTDPEEGCQPRARAKAIQEMTGSTADLAAIGARAANIFR